MQFLNSLYRPDPRGRLASSVFSANQFGNYEKMFKAPKQPRTSAQILVRGLFSTIAKLWDLQNVATWSAWNSIAANYTFTKKDKTYKLSGFLLFVKKNRMLASIGEAFITTPPLEFTPPATSPVGSSVNIVTTPGAVDIKLNLPTVLDAGTKAIIYATSVVKSGNQPKQSALKEIGVIDSTFVNGGSIMSMYLAVFPLMPATGSRVLFKLLCVSVADGTEGATANSLATGTP